MKQSKTKNYWSRPPQFSYTVTVCIMIAGFLISGVKSESSCQSYPVNRICSGYIRTSDQVLLADGMTFDDIDNKLNSLKPLLAPGSLFLANDINNNNLTSNAYVNWVCANISRDIQNYELSLDDLPNPNCNTTISSTSVFGLSDAYNFNYTNSAEACYSVRINSTAPAICYHPLKPCDNGCCIPCPQSYAFYKKGRLENWYKVTQGVRVASAIASFIMLLSYLVLPGKQSHPSILILFTSLAIFLYSSNVFFSIGDARKIQCHTENIPSDQDNNLLCGIQGALLIFSTHATTIWAAVIILNLHLHTVWNTKITPKNYIYMYIFCWGVPLLLTIIPLATHKVKYEFATLCLIEQQSANSMFFYPIAVFVIPSFFVHILTFVHIAKISSQTAVDSSPSYVEFITHKHHVIQAVKIQWRALVLAIILLATSIFYWLFYFISLRKITPETSKTHDALFSDWIKCVTYGKGQNYCTKFAAENIPSLGLLAAAEMSVSFLGIYLLIIFTNRSLWLEWGHWFISTFRRRKKLEVPKQFFAI
ncbi:11008_t:CDS:2 [Ambispora gerdemannii]|uniref:11008_t:CDS:1 n=1 Tax=Ambispora gerdemannii TaxID=144530 RepID=A0A9N9F1V7_9GLOM|nr:11008_t:CDS:2 [Ambispora gerdemannii]